MSPLDWFVMLSTVVGLALYGLWTAKNHQSVNDYMRGGRNLKWGTIGLTVMATQASAITFLSIPGQGYRNGMAFVQNYLGLPIAIIIISAFFIPMYYRLNVITAYEFLGRRFDEKTRVLGAGLFLIQRGLAAGITIYAPAIIVSSIMHWPLSPTILLSGALVILYTVAGGTRTVSLTQKYQMLIILGGMFIAFGYMVNGITEHISFGSALHLAGMYDRLDSINFSLDPGKRYTIWTGLIGGTFLALSYFGTDQSQVQRYLVGRSTSAIRAGLLFNAILKIPMQFAILLMGVLLFVFYHFHQPPIFFNVGATGQVPEEVRAPLENEYASAFAARTVLLSAAMEERQITGAFPPETKAEILRLTADMEQSRDAFKAALTEVNARADTEDSDYIFLHFVLGNLPAGLVGLLVAVIFLAAMSSTASELNALASTTMVDFYQAYFPRDQSERHYIWVAHLFTFIWGLIAVGFALTLTLFENLIEAVNIIGSLFYGTILGLFLIAFFLKRIGGHAAFAAGVVAELIVLALYASDIKIGYLWFNMIGCVLAILLALIFQMFVKSNNSDAPKALEV
ncbi:MAG TPA: sodium:solute symporter [Kiritimatiellia bacterium]|nr:sodium:solute symporter [Kiritimatiellia bacterium]